MAIGSIMPFRPTGTVSLAASTASANAALAGGGDSVVVTNTTASLAYVRFGADATVAATTADMPGARQCARHAGRKFTHRATQRPCWCPAAAPCC